MEGFQVRLKVEYSQLNSRINALKVRLDSSADIEQEEIDLMKKQLSYMEKYARVLLQRCNRNNVII